MRRGMRVALLLLLLSTLLACGTSRSSEDVIALPAWTLHASDRLSVEVTAPCHLESRLPRQRSTYSLWTAVEIPEAWRDRPVSLALNSLTAHVTLAANGLEVWTTIRSSARGSMPCLSSAPRCTGPRPSSDRGSFAR